MVVGQCCVLEADLQNFNVDQTLTLLRLLICETNGMTQFYYRAIQHFPIHTHERRQDENRHLFNRSMDANSNNLLFGSIYTYQKYTRNILEQTFQGFALHRSP